ncbi:uncharacterized protein LOC106637472 [Copidosoma floridanum]|uniref:uncharacterized protein LOC106637472 n=1 Tax=Copidosoma floridanum TaxID=29053 RepID=UPI0006C9CC6D|nr:uncharacterized protein LOC106637472 [Copidosoma floridanum]
MNWHHWSQITIVLKEQLEDLSRIMDKFWEVEDVPRKKDVKKAEESLIEAHYIQNTTREANGRYVVSLPFRTGVEDLGNSKTTALRQFYSLERRLNSNPELKTEYFRVMQDYIDQGHMSVVKNESEVSYFMPQHPVFKPSSTTTKVRAVFNASSKTDKRDSLNDVLMILVDSRDRKYQCIFWYNKDGQIKPFEMNTVTFGNASAAFLSIRTVQKLSDDEGQKFPLAQSILKHHFYVDDLITGTNSLEEIRMILKDEKMEHDQWI